jgi:hypothetical protein
VCGQRSWRTAIESLRRQGRLQHRKVSRRRPQPAPGVLVPVLLKGGYLTCRGGPAARPSPAQCRGRPCGEQPGGCTPSPEEVHTWQRWWLGGTRESRLNRGRGWVAGQALGLGPQHRGGSRTLRAAGAPGQLPQPRVKTSPRPMPSAGPPPPPTWPWPRPHPSTAAPSHNLPPSRGGAPPPPARPLRGRRATPSRPDPSACATACAHPCPRPPSALCAPRCWQPQSRTQRSCRGRGR